MSRPPKDAEKVVRESGKGVGRGAGVVVAMVVGKAVREGARRVAG
jgi:hypothetical protein